MERAQEEVGCVKLETRASSYLEQVAAPDCAISLSPETLWRRIKHIRSDQRNQLPELFPDAINKPPESRESARPM